MPGFYAGLVSEPTAPLDYRGHLLPSEISARSTTLGLATIIWGCVCNAGMGKCWPAVDFVVKLLLEVLAGSRLCGEASAGRRGAFLFRESTTNSRRTILAERPLRRTPILQDTVSFLRADPITSRRASIR